MASSAKKYHCVGCNGRSSSWVKGWRWYYGLPYFYTCSNSCEDKVFALGFESFVALTKKVAHG